MHDTAAGISSWMSMASVPKQQLARTNGSTMSSSYLIRAALVERMGLPIFRCGCVFSYLLLCVHLCVEDSEEIIVIHCWMAPF